MSRVAIVRGTNPQEMTVKALEMTSAHEAISKTKPVLVKPNYINSRHPSTGITTDSRVVEGVVMFLRQKGVENIIIGEGSGYSDTFKAFKVAGIDAVGEKWGARLMDLNKDEMIEVVPKNPLALRRVKIAKTALESTIVSVPKLKEHGMATVTLSLKNMMGAVTPKGSIHNPLSEKIVDLASIIRPSIAVIDGIIAGKGHETSGRPVVMNLVIAGTDPVAVDAVGAAVMCIAPESVEHLRLAQEKGLGTCDLRQIDVLGEPIDEVKKSFSET
jgi:uncharacterized protein (DUF362 family)